eukprot:TRINITY_DN12244_c0_g1_i1.p1 TRINITY_DN12244_c0_g1~~TRINITY_DN12244_c0_g1_i1.p1  ORF type:complete len:660 (+),score=128.82 TRINITY_DN12244_c0_g1_i1:154-2133(+)
MRPLSNYPTGVAALGWCVLHVTKRGLTEYEKATSIVTRGGCEGDNDCSMLVSDYYCDDLTSKDDRIRHHQKWCSDNDISSKEQQVAAFLDSLLVDDSPDERQQLLTLVETLLTTMRGFELSTEGEPSQLLSEWCLGDSLISSTIEKVGVLQEAAGQIPDDDLIYKIYDILGKVIQTPSSTIIKGLVKSIRDVDPLVFLFTRSGFSDWVRPLILETIFNKSETVIRVTHTAVDDSVLSPNRSLSFAPHLFSGILNDPTACPLFLAYETDLPATLLQLDRSSVSDCDTHLYSPELEVQSSLTTCSQTAGCLAASLAGVGEMYHHRSMVSSDSQNVFGYFGRTTAATLPKVLLGKNQTKSIAEASQLLEVSPFICKEEDDCKRRLSKAEITFSDIEGLSTFVHQQISELDAVSQKVVKQLLLPAYSRSGGGVGLTVGTYNVNGSPQMADLNNFLYQNDVTILTEVHRGSCSALPRCFFSDFRGTPDYGLTAVTPDIYSSFVGSVGIGEDRSAICVERLGVFIFGLHLNNSSESTRLAEMKQILKWIDNDLSVGGKPHILAGDFNSLVKSDYSVEQIDEISKSRTASCWEQVSFEVTDLLISSGYFYCFNSPVTPTCRRGTVVDQVWVKNIPFDTKRVIHPFTISDHCPVSCTIDTSQPSRTK